MHIYVHIPYCKQACHYCDFHFSTNRSSKDDMVRAIIREVEIRRSYLSQPVETIYFGGGTPSLLDAGELENILTVIYKNNALANSPEITLEANPDDLSHDKLKSFYGLGINRLSIGIQTFNDAHLRFLNRTHSGSQAFEGVQLAQTLGFNNISLDLIYALPHPDHRALRLDLLKTLKLKPTHISAYCLTIEPNTVFGKRLKTKTMPPVDEDFAATQSEILTEILIMNGYDRYEISNFSLNGLHSRHNSSYWLSDPYLGIGPGAHSFDGVNRQFNISNNAQYIKSLLKNELNAVQEKLTPRDRANELILTGLRTKRGCDLTQVSVVLGQEYPGIQKNRIGYWKVPGFLTQTDNIIKLTPRGMMFADKIAQDLFLP